MGDFPCWEPGCRTPEPGSTRGERGNVSFSYDLAADVFYIALYKPTEALGEEIFPGVILRRGLANMVVGVTLVGLEVMKLSSAVKALQGVGDVPEELLGFIDSYVGPMQIHMFGESYATR